MIGICQMQILRKEEENGQRTGTGERIAWLDIMKGLLIILMVMGHSSTPLVTYIYLFHMAAFFFLSGYTFNGSRYKTGDYIGRKVVTLLFPAFLINIIYSVFYCVLQKLGLYHFVQTSEEVPLKLRLKLLFTKLDTPDLGGATWFLFVLFEAEILCRLFYGISEICHREAVFWCMVSAAGIVGRYIIKCHIYLPYRMDLGLMACLYFGLGAAAAQADILRKLDRKVMIPLCMAGTWFFGRIYFFGELPMNWPSQNFTNLFIQLISAFAPTYLVWNIAVWLEKSFFSEVLAWLGRHTYCIVVTHFFVFRVLFGVGVLLNIMPKEQLQKLTPGDFGYQHGRWLLITLITLILCSVIGKLSEYHKTTDYIFNAKISKTHDRKNDKGRESK